MAGTKGRSGRKRKPTQQHKDDGTYREDRHGGRADEHCNLSPLRVPAGLTKTQEGLWLAVCRTLPVGVIGDIDEPAMLGLVQWYEIYKQNMQLLAARPVDEKVMATADKAWKNFCRVASEFGIGPRARASLAIVPDQKKEIDNPFEAILSRKASVN